MKDQDQKIKELSDLVKKIDNFTNWEFPTDKALKKEYDVEYVHHISNIFGNIWPTFEDFKSQVLKSKVLTINSRQDYNIHNRSHTMDIKQLVNLISSYRSWPEYRNFDTLKNMIMRFKNNEPITMPIILNFDNEHYIMSGNTKMDLALMMGIMPNILLVDVNH